MLHRLLEIKKKLLGTKLSILLVLLITFTVPGFSQQPPLRVSGATTIQPAAERAAILYTEQTGNSITIVGGGSGAGIRNVLNGSSDIGMVSRALTTSESAQLQAITYGFDALVFIVNRANPLNAITLEDVRRLYSGQLENWQNLSNWNTGVSLINKEIGRATLDLFEGYSGLNHPSRNQSGSAGRVAQNAYEIASNLEAMTLVGGIPGAIGYVSLGAAESLIEQGMPIKILQLDGVQPSSITLSNGTYPILRELNLVVLEETQRIKAFTDLFFESEIRSFIQATGVVPADR